MMIKKTTSHGSYRAARQRAEGGVGRFLRVLGAAGRIGLLGAVTALGACAPIASPAAVAVPIPGDHAAGGYIGAVG